MVSASLLVVAPAGNGARPSGRACGHYRAGAAAPPLDVGEVPYGTVDPSVNIRSVSYTDALLDWLACAAAGRDQPAARAARATGDPVVAAGAAGHVLDFDDTFLPGLAHLSAPTAPVALVLGAELGANVGEALAAYSAGFEAMGGLAAASHPALYERGFHPTAVCGALGAAVVAARLLDADERTASSIALLGAGGLRAAFGSDGKSLQVGMAAATGLRATRLAAEGASAPPERVARGFEEAYGARFSWPSDEAAISENWVKAYPCCLQAHSAIETAERARPVPDGEPLRVTVHPISLAAASYREPRDGLQAKFSIPYLVAYTLLHGPPSVESFATLDEEALKGLSRVAVTSDPSLLESEARFEAGGRELARVEAALGSPARPLSAAQLADKVRSLAGDDLDGALDDPDRPVRDLLEAAGLT
jgi:2-methylcitrate dehydratase PrpD